MAYSIVIPAPAFASVNLSPRKRGAGIYFLFALHYQYPLSQILYNRKPDFASKFELIRTVDARAEKPLGFCLTLDITQFARYTLSDGSGGKRRIEAVYKP